MPAPDGAGGGAHCYRLGWAAFFVCLSVPMGKTTACEVGRNTPRKKKKETHHPAPPTAAVERCAAAEVGGGDHPKGPPAVLTRQGIEPLRLTTGDLGWVGVGDALPQDQALVDHRLPLPPLALPLNI